MHTLTHVHIVISNSNISSWNPYYPVATLSLTVRAQPGPSRFHNQFRITLTLSCGGVCSVLLPIHKYIYGHVYYYYYYYTYIQKRRWWRWLSSPLHPSADRAAGLTASRDARIYGLPGSGYKSVKNWLSYAGLGSLSKYLHGSLLCAREGSTAPPPPSPPLRPTDENRQKLAEYYKSNGAQHNTVSPP